MPDGCSDLTCQQSGDYWVKVTCNDPLQIISDFSFLSTYNTADCNETLLEERIICKMRYFDLYFF